MIAASIIAVLAGYLLGSIPFAYIAGRLFKKVDIRRVGGGNVGTANALREVGTLPGIGVFIGDVAKGAAAVLLAKWLVPTSLIPAFIAGFAAVIGHSWSIFLKFTGGKGGATTIGVFWGLAPVASAIIFGVMLLAAFLTSNLRLAMSIGFVFLPFALWGFGAELSVIVYSIALPAFTGLRSLPAVIKSARNPGERKNFFIDKDHNPWQKKK